MDKHKNNLPLAYFITFTCYGARLHGDKRGSVDRKHNTPGFSFLKPNGQLNKYKIKQMSSRHYLLDQYRREIVLSSIKETCKDYNWYLFAVHVRSNHVHSVLHSKDSPEFVMNQFKSRSSRALNLIEARQRRWTRHGSTRYLYKLPFLFAAMRYVVYEQGKPMSVYWDPDYDLEA